LVAKLASPTGTKILKNNPQTTGDPKKKRPSGKKKRSWEVGYKSVENIRLGRKRD